MLKLTSVSKVVFGGVILGAIIHIILVTWSYYSLKSAISKSCFANIIFKQDPSIGPLFSYLAKDDINPNIRARKFREQLTWRIFVNLGIVDWSSSLEDLSPGLKASITPELERLASSTTIRHSIRIIQKLGNTNHSPSSEDYEGKLSNIIAASLANGPNAYQEFRTAIFSNEGNEVPKYNENILAFIAPREIIGFRRLWGEKVNQSDIVNLLFIHSSLAEKFDELPLGKKDGTLDPTESYRQINEYFQRLFISIHDDPEVASAQNWFTIVEGPEQFFMYITFSIGLLLLFQNRQIIQGKIPSTTKSARFSIFFYRWIQVALPSLGFIGTKRGLSEALGKADTIVRANTQINQSLAVSKVSETMGVAFTSTLVGLILLMILLIFELYIKYQKPDFNEQ